MKGEEVGRYLLEFCFNRIPTKERCTEIQKRDNKLFWLILIQFD